MIQRPVKYDLTVIDLFCGAGGITSGLVNACKEMGVRPKIIAINHWNVAIATHKKNHPDATHYCERVDALEPEKLTEDGRIDFLIAAPACTHHSNARGGKPMDDQSRASAWQVVRYAEALSPRHILLENVKEFAMWGPLCSQNKRPLKSKKGQTFAAFVAALESLGYRVEWKILNAADYGEATTRERLFVQAKRGRGKIVWPTKTHTKCASQGDFFSQDLKPWRPAREIIDWSLDSKSIFDRKKPLAPATMRRIEAGLKKFGGKHAEPFLVVLRNNADAKSVDGPIPTLTAGGGHMGLCEPFLTTVGGTEGQGRNPKSLNEPVGTILTNDRRALVQPFIIPQQRYKNQPTSVDAPIPTVTASSSDFAMVESFITPLDHEADNQPVNSGDAWGMVDPFVVTASHGDSGDHRCRSIDDPLPTVTGSNDHAVVEPFIMPVNHGGADTRTHSIDDPMPTVTTIDAWSIVESWLVKYNRTALNGKSVDEPLDTVTTKDRFGLVTTAQGQFKVDIRFRMLRPHELAAAMGFDGYDFTGNREQQVKQIGNAISVRTGKALCLAIIPGIVKIPEPMTQEAVA